MMTTVMGKVGWGLFSCEKQRRKVLWAPFEGQGGRIYNCDILSEIILKFHTSD